MRIALSAAVVAAMAFFAFPAFADRTALWTIVHDQCVPHVIAGAGPAPCESVDLARGEERGAALLKDRVGVAQFLAIPTRRIAGIEDPLALAPEAAGYFAFAWAGKRALEARLGRPLPREDVAIAVNSELARTQDQLHLHVDCMDKDVVAALAGLKDSLDSLWRPTAAPLKGRRYWARRLDSVDLGDAVPLNLLADGVEGAREQMGLESLAAVGATFAGEPGFVLLADRAEDGAGGHAEDLQDHDCAIARPAP